MNSSSTGIFTGERAMPLAPNMDPQVMREHWARYRHVAPMFAGKRVLDVACGAGYGSDMLSETARQVVGGDISPETIAYCRDHYRRDNLTFEVLDIRNIPYPDHSFEMVNSFETLEHVAEGERFLQEVTRLLTDDGMLVVSTPLGGPVGNPHHVAYYQSGTFASYLLGFFEDVKLLFQRGDQFYGETKSPNYAPTFTGEYALAFCRKPRLRIQGLTSVIILTFNQIKHTKLCLQSIEQCTPQPYELILVDNGSTDGTLEYLREYANEHNNVRVIANKENLGFSAGNNQGLALAKGNYLLLLNNDTVVTEGWLARMLSVFEMYHEVGIVGPVSNYVSGPQQVKGASYKSLEEMHQFAKQWSSEHIGQSMEFQRVVGFCLLAKREVIDRIGGLDEKFGSGNFEDDDFCLRAAAAGYKARIAQDAFIHHTGSQTFKGAGINYQQSLLRNWGIFKTKWKLPQDLPYGANYSFNLDTRDLSQYYIPLPPRAGISPLIINTPPREESENIVAPSGVFEKAIQTAQTDGNWEQTIQLLTEALNLNQTNDKAVSLWNDLGYSYFMAGQVQQAEIAFSSGLKINPNNLDLLNNLASFYLQVDDYDKATDFVNRALRLNPHDVGALRTMGDCAIKLAKFDVALRAYEHVKKLSPAADGIDQVIADLNRLAGDAATEPDRTAARD